MGATIRVQKNCKSVSMFIFAEMLFFGEHYNSWKKFHGRLRACEIFSSMKFICDKSFVWVSWKYGFHESMGFMKAASA